MVPYRKCIGKYTMSHGSYGNVKKGVFSLSTQIIWSHVDSESILIEQQRDVGIVSIAVSGSPYKVVGDIYI